MLSKIINYFSNQKDVDSNNLEVDDEVLASITYYVKDTKNGTSINIELADYDEKSAEALCVLLDTLSSDSFYLETVEIIKLALLQNDEENLLLNILTHINSQAREKILKGHKESIKDEPCIKPSDTLQ